MAKANSSSTLHAVDGDTSTPATTGGKFVKIDMDVLDDVTLRLTFIQAQLVCLSTMLIDNVDAARPSDNMIGIALDGIAQAVEDAENKLVHPIMEGAAA